MERLAGPADAKKSNGCFRRRLFRVKGISAVHCRANGRWAVPARRLRLRSRPLNDPLAKVFRANVANRAPATLSVVVQSRPGWVRIPGVRVHLRGNRRSYKGLSSSHSALTFGTVPWGGTSWLMRGRILRPPVLHVASLSFPDYAVRHGSSWNLLPMCPAVCWTLAVSQWLTHGFFW